ncbi:MAG: hypothetical protein KA354_22575 [Phycisphaerae bacterium]|nr:hypothetical protein [Phycisphaerae bacterium]
MKFSQFRLAGSGGVILLAALFVAPSRADMKEWSGKIAGGSWVADPTLATNGFTHGLAIYTAGGLAGNGLAATNTTGIHEYVMGLVTPGVYDLTGMNVLDATATDVDSDDTRNGARIFVASSTGLAEYRQSDSPWLLESTISTESGFTALVITNDQDRVWAVQNGTLREFNRTAATTWESGATITGSYVDVTAKSLAKAPDAGLVFALRATGFDEYSAGSLLRSHNNLFTGATAIAVWSDYDNVFVATESGLLHLARDPVTQNFTPAGVTVIDNAAGYRDVDVPTEDAVGTLVAYAVTSAGEIKRWAQIGGVMTFKNSSSIIGDFAHGASVWMYGVSPMLVGLIGAAGVEEWLYGNGSWSPTGAKLDLLNATDLTSDDSRNGSRIFVADESGIAEYLWGSGVWSFASTVAVGSGFTSAVIAFDQDRLWAIQNGNAREFIRSGVGELTWNEGVTIAGGYVDVAARSLYPTALVFLLRDTGIDEVENQQIVRSHDNLFSGATGIATWVDQDSLFVSTTGGLLYVPRTIGGPDHLKFDPANVRVIDPQPYRDVATSTEGASIPGALLYCRGVTGLPVTGCSVPFADADADSDVDQADFGLWQACYTGDGGMAFFDAAKCKCFDRDHDTDVDGVDLQAFKNCWKGPAITADSACGK